MSDCRLAMTIAGMMAASICLMGCTHHIDVQPIRVEPIYAKFDVNVNLKVDRELDQFFDFKDAPGSPSPSTTTQPAGPAVPPATAPSAGTSPGVSP